MAMTRSELREKIMTILYQIDLYKNNKIDYEVSDVIKENLEIDNEFVKDIVYGVIENYDDVTKVANDNLKDWSIDRLDSMGAAILRMAIYEMKYTDTPDLVVINEAIDLAKKVVEVLNNSEPHFKLLYNQDLTIKEKIDIICKQIYRANSVVYTEEAEWKIKDIEYIGYSKLPICMAKTPLSFSDDPNLIGAPRNFKITIRDVNLSAGAGFIVALTGKIMTMPGLPAVPAAVKMEDEEL